MQPLVISKDTDASPRFIWLELTNKCNLECVHCYNDSSPDAADTTLTEQQYRRLIDEAAGMKCRAIQFIGGEPTASKSLEPLMEYAALRGIAEIEIYSNLVSVSDRLIQLAHRLGAKFATSFYSHIEDVHDAITKRKGSHARTSENIRRLLSEGVEVRAGFIEMIENKGHYEQTTSYLKKLGIKDIGFDRARKFGRAAAGQCGSIEELCGKCGQGSLCVNYDGTISPCIMSKFIQLGTVQTNSLSEILMDAPLREFRQLIEAKVGDYCQPQCEPVCNPRCSPNCSPCYPAGKCNPELF